MTPKGANLLFFFAKNCLWLLCFFTIFTANLRADENHSAAQAVASGSHAQDEKPANQTEVTYQYRGCERISEHDVSPEPDKVVKVKNSSPSNTGQLAFTAVLESDPKSISFESTAKEKHDSFTVWRGKGKVDWFGSRETQVEVIETDQTPKRTIYMVVNPLPSDVWRSYGDPAGADPRPMGAREVILFDNLGNYAEIRAEYEKGDKAKKYFRVAETCAGKDLFGFSPTKHHLPFEAPVTPKQFPWDLVPRKQITTFPGTKSAALQEDPILPLGDVTTLKAVSERMLKDPQNLSPVLKKFANSLRDNSYKNEPLWKLRSFLLNRVQLEPEAKKN